MTLFNIQGAQVTSFVVWFFVFYLYHGLGTTLGYHRLLTHKALNVPTWLKYFIVSGGYLGLMGAPISWVATHRLHHQKSDIEGDPHSPLKGVKYALYGWMFDMDRIQTREELLAQTQDMLSDKLFVWLGTGHDSKQAQKCLAFAIAFRVLIYFTLGLAPLLANLAATFCTFWSTQFVNAFCHMKSLGYRTYETRDLSRNVWWVGILALGEGWHNNHHAIPKSARHGLTWKEVDVTWYAIWLLEKLGLAKGIILPPKVSKLNLDSIKTKVSDVVASNLNKVNEEIAKVNNEIALEPIQMETATAYRSNN